MNKGLSSGLDASRWIAALMVVISHVHHLVLANYPDVASRAVAWKLFYFLGSFGGESVVVFFVVSGYLVGGLTAKKWLRQSRLGQPPLMQIYFIQRFARIYTVLVPALLTGWLFDYLGARLFDDAQLYTDASQYHTISLAGMMVANLGLDVFAGNLLMLQHIVSPVLGTNGPLWSLAYEWWYYCIFAVVMGAIIYRGARRWLCLILIAMALVLLPAKLLIWMAVWSLGLAALYYLESDLPKPRPLPGVAVLVVALIVCRFNHSSAENGGFPEPLANQFFRDFGLGLAYAFALVSFSRLKKTLWLAEAHAYLASFSYSLYLTHFPLMVLLVAMAKALMDLDFLRQPSVASYAYMSGLLALLCAYGLLFSIVTERQTVRVKLKLQQLISLGWLRRQVRP